MSRGINLKPFLGILGKDMDHRFLDPLAFIPGIVSGAESFRLWQMLLVLQYLTLMDLTSVLFNPLDPERYQIG